MTEFWAGYAGGVLTTAAVAAALWYGMLRYLRGMDPADLGQAARHPSDILRDAAEDRLRRDKADSEERKAEALARLRATHTVIHVGEDDPPDPLPLPDRYAGETCACSHGRAAHRGIVGRCRIPDCLCEGWMNAERWDRLDTRGPTTDYPPGATHHDLTPIERDGIVTYTDTRRGGTRPGEPR